MKKVIGVFVFTISAGISLAQNEIKNVRVVGSYDYGVKEITSFIEVANGCLRKSNPHEKGIFVVDEYVQIEISENKQVAEVLKPNLVEKVFVNKNCGSAEFDYSKLTVEQKILEFNKIGQIHNEGLDYVYNFLVEKSNNNNSIQQTTSFAEQGLNKYMLTLNLQSNFWDVKKGIDDIFKSNSMEAFLLSKLNQVTFTPIQTLFMDSINKEFDKLLATENATQFDKNLYNLELSAIEKLNDNEEVVILCYLAISKASISYWIANGDHWYDDIPNVKKPTYWGKVVKADGALAGAAAFGAAALFGGPVSWSAFGISVGSWSTGCSVYQLFYP